MDSMEECELYKISKLQPNWLLNDKLSFKSNHLYNTATYIEIHLDNQGNNHESSLALDGCCTSDYFHAKLL